MSNLLENIDMKTILKGINIRMPATSIIGAIEFDKFLESNDLFDLAFHSNDQEKIKAAFLAGDLSVSLKDKLMQYIQQILQAIGYPIVGLV